MNYLKVYKSLVNNRLNNPAFNDEHNIGEKHHIIPRALEKYDIILDLFKEYEINQLVNLTYREHFIAHKLLVNFFSKDVEKYKDVYYRMVYAFNILSHDGYHCTTSKDYEMVRKFLTDAVGISVECYDLNGNFVKEYKSFTDTAKDGFSPPTVGECCNKKHHKNRCIYNKLIWKLKSDNTPIEEIIKTVNVDEYLYNLENLVKPVLCYDLKGNLIKEYETIASTTLDGFNHNRVGQCCNMLYAKSKCIYADHIWKFKKDTTPIKKLLKYVKIYHQIKMNKSVYAYNSKGELVKKYSSTVETEKDGYCRVAVGLCCNNKYHKKKNVYKGLIWKFEFDETPIQNIINGVDNIDDYLVNSNDTTRKPVVCYTLDGEFVKEYRSLCSTEKDGFNKKRVARCCNSDKENIYKNYIWKYKE